MIRLVAPAAIAALFPAPAWAASVIVFDKETISFFFLVSIVTGTVAWWRTMRGDNVVMVVILCAILVIGLSMLRYDPSLMATAFYDLFR